MYVLTLVAIFLGRFDSDLHYKTGLITAYDKDKDRRKCKGRRFCLWGGGGEERIYYFPCCASYFAKDDF